MTVPTLPLAEINHRAIRVLARELGVANTARFLIQFGAGRGDYTAERHALFEDTTLEQLIAEARRLDDAQRAGD
jgi:hypothetical protein